MKKLKSTLILRFFQNENASGILLLLCALIAILLANSPISAQYTELLHKEIQLGFSQASITMSLSHWINDGLMAIFFFVVGMEIKMELLIGELKSIKKTILPIAAALGGMIVPALIYSLCNLGQPTINGFGIPMATDIAFALGVISLAGKKAPRGIIVFLTALAIVDDLGAIIVIAIFYTSSLSFLFLFASILLVICLFIISRSKFHHPAIFLLLGILLWFTMLKSGIHATFAGVILGLMIPGTRDATTFKHTLLHKMEHVLSPFSSYIIMPVFALANAGVAINSASLSTIMVTPVSMGIILGLFLGKQLGIFFVSILLVKLHIAKLPSHVTKIHLYGASILGGIGFTMSIFVASLSFTDTATLATAKISIISASLLSAIVGLTVFKCIKPKLEDCNLNHAGINVGDIIEEASND